MNETLAKLKTDVESIFRHTVVLFLTLASIWGVNLFIDATLGNNLKFFDLIPLRWVIHVGDLLAFLKYLMNMFEDFES